MTEHLPECFASLCECDDTHFKSIDCDFSCICPSLRACEQRTLDAARKAVDRLASEMANWSSAETVAATGAVPDLTADRWIGAAARGLASPRRY